MRQEAHRKSVTENVSSLLSTDKTGTRQDLRDGGCEPHDDGLYAYKSLAPISGTDQLPSNPDDLLSLKEDYDRDGFLAFDGIFSPQPMSDSIDNLTHGRNRAFSNLVRERVVSNQIPDFTSGAKIPWVQYEKGTDLKDDQSLVLTPSVAGRVRKLMGFSGFEKPLDAIVNNERLLRLVTNLLGVSSSDEIELFQDMALLKPAGGGREKPWHQDKAYFDIGLDTDIVGCWIAVDEATCENGCLRMQRGGYKTGPRMHFTMRDYQICDVDAPKAERDDVVAVPLSPGGLVLFHGLVPHGTPTNNTISSRRRALQFHWMRKGSRIVREMDPGGRAQVFGGAHNGLSC